MRKADLIIRLMSGLYGLSMDTANVVADYILARETAMLEEIEEHLFKSVLMNYTKKQLSMKIDEALSIIQRRKGGE
jgi:hypothetical protein